MHHWLKLTKIPEKYRKIVSIFSSGRVEIKLYFVICKSSQMNDCRNTLSPTIHSTKAFLESNQNTGNRL
jgi:hypothetical protein